MSGKTKKLMNQESREDYVDEAAEGATEILEGGKEFDGADDEFEGSRVEENASDVACSEERATR